MSPTNQMKSEIALWIITILIASFAIIATINLKNAATTSSTPTGVRPVTTMVNEYGTVLAGLHSLPSTYNPQPASQ